MNDGGANAQDHAEVSKRIEDAFTQLSPQLQRAARYLLDRPDEVALQSMRWLAASAGVNPATMVRLAQALDYPGFEALREPFRERLRHPADRYRTRARELQSQRRGQNRDETLLAEMLAADQDNLRRSFEDIGFDALSESAACLANARRIYVVGLRSCHPIAFYFNYACQLFRAGVTLVEGSAGTLTDGLRGIEREDAMLAVSFAPYTRETVRVVRFAAKRGVALVAVTDSKVSPLATVATHALVVTNSSPTLFQSPVSAMAVTQALLALLLLRGGDSALSAVAESEALLHEFNSYWEDAPPWTTRPNAITDR